MKATDRQQLEALHFEPDTIAKIANVLRIWEVEDLFVPCATCGTLCISPRVPKRQYRRVKPPAVLYQNREWLGFIDREGKIVCWPCDEERFQ